MLGWSEQAAEFIRQTSCRATFVLMLEHGDSGADTYNEFRRMMAENVESATVQQDIALDLES